LLKSLGHDEVSIDYPDLPIGPTVGTIIDAEGASAFEDLIRSGKAKMLRVKQDRIGGFEQAATLAVDYIRAQRVRAKIRRALIDLLGTVDFIVAPTRASVAYPIGPDFETVYPDISGGPSLIGGMNLAGAPAISVPNGFGENNLPTAMQIIAAPGRDAGAIALAAAYQEKTDWHSKVPPGF
jgi:aspartyl-tRNA(Asn)/glutamyl-tRNA(Gln) amidotransferase subunit A